VRVARLVDIHVAFGAGLEELDAELVCERLALAVGHGALALVHIALVADQHLPRRAASARWPAGEPRRAVRERCAGGALRASARRRLCEQGREAALSGAPQAVGARAQAARAADSRRAGRALFTLSEACCSMLRIQFRMLVNEASSVTSYTSRIPIAPR
jgi:hypothetical protein